MNALNNQKTQSDAVARFESGAWDAFQKIQQEEFGNNFPIEKQRGYVIRINNKVQFTP